jgi:uncharacterized protein (TIGR00369 family)
VKPLELLQAQARGEVPPPPIADTVGMRLVEIEPGRALFELEAEQRHANPMGTVHGGILCDLADAAMGCAYASLLEEGETFTTLELKINFLRPFWTGHLTASGTVASSGRTVGLTECEIRDEHDRLIAKATSTCMTLRGDAADGRAVEA